MLDRQEQICVLERFCRHISDVCMEKSLPLRLSVTAQKDRPMSFMMTWRIAASVAFAIYIPNYTMGLFIDWIASTNEHEFYFD